MTQFQEMLEHLTPEEINAGSQALNRNGFNEMDDHDKAVFLKCLKLSASMIQLGENPDKLTIRMITIIIAVAGHSIS